MLWVCPPTHASSPLHTLPLQQLRADYYSKRREVRRAGPASAVQHYTRQLGVAPCSIEQAQEAA